MEYLLNNDNSMKDGDTIDGIRNGMIVQDIQWKCQYEDTLFQPERADRNIIRLLKLGKNARKTYKNC